MTDEQAAVRIQATYKGFKVRKEMAVVQGEKWAKIGNFFTCLDFRCVNSEIYNDFLNIVIFLVCCILKS